MALEYNAIRTRAQQTLVDFLNTEISLGHSLTRSAANAYDAGRTEHFSEAKERATKAAETVKRFVVGVVDGTIRGDIEGRLAVLERAIAGL